MTPRRTYERLCHDQHGPVAAALRPEVSWLVTLIKRSFLRQWPERRCVSFEPELHDPGIEIRVCTIAEST